MGSGARRDVTQRDEPSGGDSRGTGPRGGDAAPGGDVSAGELVVGVAEDEVGGPQQRQRVRRQPQHVQQPRHVPACVCVRGGGGGLLCNGQWLLQLGYR